MTAAKIIKFRKAELQPQREAGKSMYSDKFDQGYVMSSRLYRKEVWPFLSDAARNVYAELENRINGHNKESDFISYSQLQGSDLPGARQLGRKTVSAGLKELIELGVISVISTGKQGVKSYRLNEVSLKDRFTNETSSPSEPVPLVNQNSSPSEPVTSSPSEHTIDSYIESIRENDNKREGEFVAQNKSMLQFIEYYPQDSTRYSIKEFANNYPVANDFTKQAVASFPNLSSEQIHGLLKELGQWALKNETVQTPQSWISTWLTFLKNHQSKVQEKAGKTTTAAKPKTGGRRDFMAAAQRMSEKN
ncbi:replication protein [Acinetobacter radioresistens]|jgi:hypothetical protein|uniref:hypothetical protein n=2 Tax=Moraxellaceae TaxID=468 RepID=UPI002003B873|nr:hypothetical protein [Acinetobacter radioresistens]MCK4094281.1 replication protein [Acinetobacter radioresistens]